MSTPPEFATYPRQVQLESMEYRYQLRTKEEGEDRHGPDDMLLAWATPRSENSRQWDVYINENMCEWYNLPIKETGLLVSSVDEQTAKRWVIGLGRMLKRMYKAPFENDG